MCTSYRSYEDSQELQVMKAGNLTKGTKGKNSELFCIVDTLIVSDVAAAMPCIMYYF